MKILCAKQYTPEWWAARRGKPSVSNFHRIVTPKKWEWATGAESYAAELIGECYDYNYGPQSEYATVAMKNGTIMEPAARRFYEFETNADVTEVGLVGDDSQRFVCSPDGLVGDEGGLELKHPTAATHVKWLLADEVPTEHLAQCHGSLLVTKRDWWDFMAWYPGLPPLLKRVTPDEKTVALAEAIEKFWTMLSAMRQRIEGGTPIYVANGECESPF